MSEVKKEQGIIETPEVTEEVKIEEANPVTPVENICTDYEIRIQAKVTSGDWTQDDADKAITDFARPVKSLKTFRTTGVKISKSVGAIIANASYVGLYENAEDLTMSCYGLTIGLGPLANIDSNGKCIFKGDKDYVNLVLSGYPVSRAKELYKKSELLEKANAISRTPNGISIDNKSLSDAKNLNELKAGIRNILNPKSGSNNSSLSSHDLWNSCRSIQSKMESFIDRQSELNLTDNNKNIEIVEFLDKIIELAPQLKKLVVDEKK